MSDVKKRRNGWGWLLGAILFIGILFLGLYYFKLHNGQVLVPDQTQTFVQEQGNQLMNNVENQLQPRLANLVDQSIVSQLITSFGIGEYTFAMFSLLLVIITFAALITGWYLRSFGKKKWLGYILSFIGFLPLLPIIVAATAIYWLGKMYWRGGKIRKKAAKVEKTNELSVLDDWEQSFHRLEKAQS